MCIASVNVNTSTITEKEEVKSKLLSFDGVNYYVWSVCYTDDGQANKIYHSTVPSPNSSSISSPSSNSFRNRAWSCSLFFFCQYLYAATTPRTNTVETRALINMTTARCVSFPFLWGFEAELESIDKWKTDSWVYFWTKSCLHWNINKQRDMQITHRWINKTSARHVPCLPYQKNTLKVG